MNSFGTGPSRAGTDAVQIGRRPVGGDNPMYIIAEVGLAHEGSLGTAMAFVDVASEVGADAVKFQTHIASAESSSEEMFRVPVFPQDRTRHDYWERTAFSPEEWHTLRDHSRSRGLDFLSSPFSVEAAELLQALDVPAWKVASGETSNLPLIKRLAETGLPVLLSSGMSSVDELDRAVRLVRETGGPLAVFQCTSAYPCPPEKVGLNLIPEFQVRYRCPVGLSDHSGTVFPGLAAALLGASLLEVHLTFSRQMFGPDVSASITPTEFRQLVQGVRFLENARRHPVDKNGVARELEPLRRLFTKSVVVAQDLPPGHRIRAEDLELRKPGIGIPAAELGDVVGRRVRTSLAAGTFLSYEALKDE